MKSTKSIRSTLYKTANKLNKAASILGDMEALFSSSPKKVAKRVSNKAKNKMVYKAANKISKKITK